MNLLTATLVLYRSVPELFNDRGAGSDAQDSFDQAEGLGSQPHLAPRPPRVAAQVDWGGHIWTGLGSHPHAPTQLW